MYFGAHISAAGGVQNAPINAAKHQAECYQLFSRSPRGGKAPDLTPPILKEFKDNNKKYGFTHYYIHSPYYINLASSNNKIYFGSIEVLRQELERGTTLKAKGMMFHIGSSRDLGQKQAIAKVIQGLKKVIKNYTGACRPLLEISAGAGLIIGDTFEEIAEIIKRAETQKNKGLLGVCFDTAHAFASGYDLRTPATVKKTFNQFNKLIGLKRLSIIHLNDSKADFNSHRDRHEHLGQGKIGQAGFKAIIKYFQKKKIKMDFIVETPTDIGVTKDITLLKKLRDNK